MSTQFSVLGYSRSSDSDSAELCPIFEKIPTQEQAFLLLDYAKNQFSESYSDFYIKSNDSSKLLKSDAQKAQALAGRYSTDYDYIKEISEFAIHDINESRKTQMRIEIPIAPENLSLQQYSKSYVAYEIRDGIINADTATKPPFCVENVVQFNSSIENNVARVRIKNIRIERLHDISLEDAVAEGVCRLQDDLTPEKYQEWVDKHNACNPKNPETRKQSEWPFKNFLWHGNTWWDQPEVNLRFDAWDFQENAYDDYFRSFLSIWYREKPVEEWPENIEEYNPYVWVFEFENEPCE